MSRFFRPVDPGYGAIGAALAGGIQQGIARNDQLTREAEEKRRYQEAMQRQALLDAERKDAADLQFQMMGGRFGAAPTQNVGQVIDGRQVDANVLAPTAPMPQVQGIAGGPSVIQQAAMAQPAQRAITATRTAPNVIPLAPTERGERFIDPSQSYGAIMQAMQIEQQRAAQEAERERMMGVALEAFGGDRVRALAAVNNFDPTWKPVTQQEQAELRATLSDEEFRDWSRRNTIQEAFQRSMMNARAAASGAGRADRPDLSWDNALKYGERQALRELPVDTWGEPIGAPDPRRILELASTFARQQGIEPEIGPTRAAAQNLFGGGGSPIGSAFSANPVGTTREAGSTRVGGSNATGGGRRVAGQAVPQSTKDESWGRISRFTSMTRTEHDRELEREMTDDNYQSAELRRAYQQAARTAPTGGGGAGGGGF